MVMFYVATLNLIGNTLVILRHYLVVLFEITDVF